LVRKRIKDSSSQIVFFEIGMGQQKVEWYLGCVEGYWRSGRVREGRKEGKGRDEGREGKRRRERKREEERGRERKREEERGRERKRERIDSIWGNDTHSALSE
jgi:hypothetical protein